MARSLVKLVAALEELVPLRWAEKWDNVGLVLDAARPRQVGRILLAIDLSPAVLEEAKEAKAGLVIAYHPPIFAALKSLRRSRPRDRTLLTAISANIAVWSPHTALDAAPSGVNDWLCSGLGEAEVEPLGPRFEHDAGQECKVVVFAPAEVRDALLAAMSAAGAGRIGRYAECSFNLEGVGTFRGLEGTHPAVGKAGRLEEVPELRVEMVCAKADLPAVARAIRRVHPYEEPAWEVVPLAARPMLGVGPGRLATLRGEAAIETIVRRLKKHLGVQRLRVARAPRHEADAAVSRVAVCAGAGASVIADADADLLVTGEMRHHDVLAALERDVSVILCEHSNSERGYLPRFAERLREHLGDATDVLVSQRDREPLEVI